MRPAHLYEQQRIGLVLIRVKNAASEKMIGCVDLRHITTDLFIEVQSAIRAGCFYKTKEYWSMVLEVVYWLAAILDSHESPLSYGSKEFCQIDM